MKSSIASFVCCTLLICTGQSLGAQRTREISLAAGASQFDASGTGTGPIMALRASAPLVSSWLVGDLNFALASFDEQFSSTNTKVGVAEGQLQAQWPSFRVRPYVGLGGGWLHYFNNSEGRDATGPTISGAVGVRFIANPLMLRGEMRLRAWQSAGGGYNNSAAEFTAGVGLSF